MTSEEFMKTHLEKFLDERNPLEQNIILYGLLREQILINKNITKELNSLWEQVQCMSSNDRP